MLSRDAAKAIIKRVSAETEHYATVFILDSESGVTRFANSEITQNVSVADTSVSFTMFNGKKEATCSTNDVSTEGLKAVVKDAGALLEYVPEGDYEPFEMPHQPVPESAPDGKLAEAFNVTQRAAKIKDGIGKSDAGYTAAGALTLERHAVAVGDTKGAFRYSAFDKVLFNTVVTHADGAAGAGECCSYTDVPDISAAFDKAYATAAAARDPVGVDLGAYMVVLSPVAFGDLIEFATMLLGAESVEDGDSYAIGKIGERLFGENLTIRDDSANPLLRPLRFDYEGTARKTIDLVDKGVVCSYLYDNKLAVRHKAENTGHAVSNKGQGGYASNIIVEGGNQTVDEIIRETDTGIYINEFHYTNYVNPRQLQITGLTRNGTFLIENGKLTKPVTTMRFTVSLLEAFNEITAISEERRLVEGFFGASLIPTARIDGFRFTSKP